MVDKRIVLACITVASLASACTAIVIGKVGETNDYRTVAIGGSNSGLDECSLQRGDYSGTDVDANACSTCIESSCKTDVEYACNRGQSSKKPWFSKLKECARTPWIGGYAPEGYANNSYQCGEYRDAEAPISDKGSDTEREVTAHNCVTNKCLSGDLPACKQCEVTIQKSSTTNDPRARLQDDTCGACLFQNCQPTMVKCCGTDPMDDFVRKCAFTANATNKAACLELGKAQPDAGKDNGYPDGGTSAVCLGELSACFKANCAGGKFPGCQ